MADMNTKNEIQEAISRLRKIEPFLHSKLARGELNVIIKSLSSLIKRENEFVALKKIFGAE